MAGLGVEALEAQGLRVFEIRPPVFEKLEEGAPIQSKTSLEVNGESERHSVNL